MSAPSFEADIRPLFRAKDRDSMLNRFDLWSVDDVSSLGPASIRRLSALPRAWLTTRVQLGLFPYLRLMYALKQPDPCRKNPMLPTR
jgi:hypothetical protein